MLPEEPTEGDGACDCGDLSLVPVPQRSIIYGGGWRAVATSLAFAANGFYQS